VLLRWVGCLFCELKVEHDESIALKPNYSCIINLQPSHFKQDPAEEYGEGHILKEKQIAW